jgi:wyosine [tRNA(Phe)-imidazoG37] synthetase (radical SAM superfamily)
MPKSHEGPAALLPLIGHVVYGPVHSRRLGWSLGVNLLPPGIKVCTFNCVYCQYGWTSPATVAAGAWPTATDVASALAQALADGDTAGRIERITLAGHGEPTLHPDLAGVVAALADVRRRLAPRAALAILSNGTRVHVPAVRAALEALDECYVKLDAGTQDTMRRVNASAFPLTTLVETLRTLRGVVLQSMFVEDPKGRAGNASPACLDAWFDTVLRIGPAGVHLYTLDRAPALPRLQPVSRERLGALAARLRAHDVPALVF